MLPKFLRKTEKAAKVDPLIDAVLDEMNGAPGPNSSEYPQMMTYLERLYMLKDKEKPEAVSRDTIALIAGNLLGILIIVAYEKNNVMTSKGFSQLIRTQK